MLALSRKKDEALVINNNIEITVLEVKGDHVKLGITAPKSVPVYRKEVYLQIQESNKESASASAMRKPMLWRVPTYSGPMFPSPTIRNFIELVRLN